MSLLTAEIENLSEIEEQFFLEGFRMETEGLAEVEELYELYAVETVVPPRGLLRRMFGV